jgi:hypothetical protein
MLVEELLEETRADIFNRQREVAKEILAQKLCEIKRTEEILAAMHENLAEFKQSDVEKIDISGIRY